MKVVNLKTNHIVNPLGFGFEVARVSYQVIETNSSIQTFSRIEVALDELFNHIIFDTKKIDDINHIGYDLPIELLPKTRYFWRVTVWGDKNDVVTSNTAWFETAKQNEPWKAQWICRTNDSSFTPLFHKKIALENKAITTARAYICGLGLYELYINDSKISDELLAPGCHVYDQWLQYQTYDITEALKENNAIDILMGDGWYKGRFGFNNPHKENNYGDHHILIAEFEVNYADGSKQLVTTDSSWFVKDSPISKNSIYDGETIFACHESALIPCAIDEQQETRSLRARQSLPVKIHETIQPVHSFKNEKGQLILDFGQNIVGWVEIKQQLPKGTTITLEHAEILQGNDLYTENLKSAKASFHYEADGLSTHIRPHFSFFGFRYVKVTASTAIEPENFVACFIYSDLQQTGTIETNNSLINQFFQNVLRSQKGNFLDLPTDCPQRDERMGWTGDIQVFSGTACYNMDVYAFLNKYLIDLAKEQQKFNGSVPFVIPVFDVKEAGSSGWGDAATIIPWTLWEHYGDPRILKQQYQSMKDWVNFMVQQVEAQNSESLLWDSGFHFGDWLALDNEPNIKSFKGRTEDKFIASIYFHYSATIVGKAAEILESDEDAKYYFNLSKNILSDLRNEYVTQTGRLALDTQTGYVLAIIFDLIPNEYKTRVAADFKKRLKRDDYNIKTGFIGTPFICKALSKIGLHDEAVDLFTRIGCPSWLYPITQGATTVWERWDSVLADGSMNQQSNMNSLNHYAFGSVTEWLYQTVFGLKPTTDEPGFKHALITPKPHYKLKQAKMSYQSIAGEYQIGWHLTNDGQLQFNISIPFDCHATVLLPDVTCEQIFSSLQSNPIQQKNQDVLIQLSAGEYNFSYQPTKEYFKRYNTDISLAELMANIETKSVLEKHIPDIITLPFIKILEKESLMELANKPFFKHEKSVLHSINQELNQYTII